MSALGLDDGPAAPFDECAAYTVECEHPLFRCARLRLAPGERTARHRRDVDAVAFYFSSTTLRVEAGDDVAEAAVGPDIPVASDHSSHPGDRRLTNAGDAPLRALEVELPRHALATSAKLDAFVTGVPDFSELSADEGVTKILEPLPWCCPKPRRVTLPDGSKSFERKTHGFVDVFRFRLPPGAATQIHSCDRPRLFVWYATAKVATRHSDGNEHVRRVVAGSYLFDDRRFHGTLANAGDTALEAVVVLWNAVAPY